MAPVGIFYLGTNVKRAARNVGIVRAARIELQFVIPPTTATRVVRPLTRVHAGTIEVIAPDVRPVPIGRTSSPTKRRKQQRRTHHKRIERSRFSHGTTRIRYNRSDAFVAAPASR